MMEKKITGISFENLKDDSGTYPIVRSMSEIAGKRGHADRRSVPEFIQSWKKGCFWEGSPGIPPTKVIILGAGIVGEFASPGGAGAWSKRQSLLDNSVYRLKRLQNNIGQRMWTSVIEPRILAKQIKTCEIAVGAPVFSKRSDAGGSHRRDGQQYAPGQRHHRCQHRQGRVFRDLRRSRPMNKPCLPKIWRHPLLCPQYPFRVLRVRLLHAISNVLMPLLLEAGEEGVGSRTW